MCNCIWLDIIDVHVHLCGIRHAFLQILDEKRGRFSTLDNFTFEYMKIAMKIFLDKCIEPRSVKSALRLANMSITFHKLIPEKEESGSDTELRKHYIQREVEINQHELWHMVGFWDEALSNGLREQLTMMDPVEWDELPPDVLTEKVVGMVLMLLAYERSQFAITRITLVCPHLSCQQFITYYLGNLEL